MPPDKDKDRIGICGDLALTFLGYSARKVCENQGCGCITDSHELMDTVQQSLVNLLSSFR